MPDDYYVSKYSGEEIDALLGGAGAGTVRYDAAQSLTDAQKTQARGNINAAPGGFGLGGAIVYAPENSDGASDANLIDATGFYLAIANAGGGGWNYVFHMQYPSAAALQFSSYVNDTTYSIRKKIRGVWQPWEWVDPPLALGEEYRTTERYLDKPVYVKAVNFGSLPNNSLKTVTFGDNTIKMISAHGIMTGGYVIPGCTGSSNYPVQEMQIYTADGGNIGILTHTDRSNLQAVIVAKYWKTTD